MSNRHLSAIRPLQMPAPTKLALYALCERACETCGMCWPGLALLATDTCLKRARIQQAISELKGMGLIEIHAYPRGGRGRASEYVVLPRLPELSTAPCGKCASNLLKSPYSGRYDESGTGKQPTQQAVSGKPPTDRVVNHPLHGYQASVEAKHQRARAREMDPSASPSGAAMPPMSDSPPRNATEARQAVEQLFRASDPPARPDRPSHAKPEAKDR
jgi:hypothetical protein